MQLEATQVEIERLGDGRWWARVVARVLGRDLGQRAQEFWSGERGQEVVSLEIAPTWSSVTDKRSAFGGDIYRTGGGIELEQLRDGSWRAKVAARNRGKDMSFRGEIFTAGNHLALFSEIAGWLRTNFEVSPACAAAIDGLFEQISQWFSGFMPPPAAEPAPGKVSKRVKVHT